MATNSSSSRSTDSPRFVVVFIGFCTVCSSILSKNHSNRFYSFKNICSKADKINNNNSSNKSSIITSEEFVGFNAILPDTIPVPLNSSAKVMLVYWKSPFEFHVQLKSMDDKCIEMMQQIQTYYKKRAPIQKKIPIDSLVLARFKEDRMIKRAKVIDYNASKDKYRVQFIDFGATAVCQLADMYEMEKSFTRLPAMAINCTFQGVDMKKSAAEVNEKVDQLIGSGDNIECRFIDKDGDTFVVDMMIGGTNLKELLIREQFLAIQKGEFFQHLYSVFQR